MESWKESIHFGIDSFFLKKEGNRESIPFFGKRRGIVNRFLFFWDLPNPEFFAFFSKMKDFVVKFVIT